MAGEDLVRPSRDGDQFHYYWAARLCLGLLPPNTDLVAISIEGPAVSDGEVSDAGINSIDIAEYKGTTDPRTATHVRYLQLKHSSRRQDEEWIASDLTGTLENFGKRYVALTESFGAEDLGSRFSFEFVTNRPLAKSLEDGLDQLRNGRTTGRARAAANAMRLPVDTAAALAKILILTGRTEHYLQQRSLLHDDVSGYLPEADRDTSLQMKNLVEQRATTEFERRPEITRLDVLKAIGADVRDMYPAPSLIELPSAIVPRAQLQSLTDLIVAGGSLSILSADAGVGKSVLSTQLGSRLPDGSVLLVYDCFGNGAYRSASGYRHRCRDGLVQLANELAGLSLSEPLVPTSKADPAAYVRAFLLRAQGAAARLEERSPGAILCIVIDAADNAQIAADELHEGASFPRLLLREAWPSNMRVVMTARPHRIDMLNPPAAVPRIELVPFSEAETGVHLRGFFPEASDQDVLEFHRQTSMNPRVQATALAQQDALAEVLRSLAGAPRTVEDLIGDLLEASIAKVQSDAPETERGQIDHVCAALATLRPFVPLEIVARVADVSVGMVRSLAHDLQRPLIVREDAIQFRDEPTETWFRQRFRPSGTQLNEFITRLLPIAASSVYVAAGLPQLLLEAGRFDELVQLALTDDALPTEPAMARRDVALQRLQFALKAAIRTKRYLEAAKLALKAGGETAADARQQKLISANTDLARYFLEPDQMLEQVTRRLITAGEWTGSEHAYEAAFLSCAPELAGDARSRLRVADDWLRHWATRPRNPVGKNETVANTDNAEIALAELNLHGATSSAKSLRRWRARGRSYSAGRVLVSRLVDAGRFDDIAELAIAAGNDLGLLLAITSELETVGRLPPRNAIVRMTRLVTSRHVRDREPSGHGGEIVVLGAITSAVAAAVQFGVAPRRMLARTISRYMSVSTSMLSGRSATFQNRRAIYLRAFCLRAALRNESVTVEKLKPEELRRSRAKSSRPSRRSKRRHRYVADSGEAIRFSEDMGALLPWHLLSVDVLLGRVATITLEQRVEAVKAESSKASHRTYDEDNSTSDEIAMLWSEIAFRSVDPPKLLHTLDEWHQGLRRPLFIPTLLAIARRAGRTPACETTCLALARSAFEIMAAEREDAQGIADTFVEVCRAVLLVSLPEAREYFEQAIEVSGKIGEENTGRWRALSDLAVAAGVDRVDRAELAYRYSRVAELVLAYTEHFDWAYSLQALAGLSPPSGLTILSRWIDRRFAYEPDTLPELTLTLERPGDLDPRDAICLIPFDARWSRIQLLRRALAKAPEVAERAQIATHFIRYARKTHLDAKDWRRVAEMLKSVGLEPDEALDLARAAERAARDRKGAGPSVSKRERLGRREPARDWGAVFNGVKLTDAGDILVARARFRSGKPPWSTELFFREAVLRVAPGQEAGYFAAVEAAAFSSLYDARELLDAIPDDWVQSLAVQRAVARFLRNLARRECTSITTSSSYAPLRWETVAKFGLTRDDIFREAVTAMGDTSLPVDHDDLFGLAGLLSIMVAPEEAASSLGYGLSLMEPLLLPGDDGPWRTELHPPATASEALAGYLWSALASPWAERRWEATHAVRALCATGRRDVLDHLAKYAAVGTGDAFAAPELTFYALHAQLWLTIAMARAAEDHPATVTNFIPHLQAAASPECMHVLIREFAGSALLSLHAHGEISLTTTEQARLQTINISTLAAPAKRRSRSSVSRLARKAEGFLFGHDFDQSWLSPLASCFDTERSDVEKEAVSAIRSLWGPDEDGSYARDSRAQRQQFKDDSTYRLQSHWPNLDDLGFYQSSHALMIAAGQLLARVPLNASPDEPDPFNAWLDRHRLSFESGVWLADRRDDKPSGLWIDLPRKKAAEAFDAAALMRLVVGPGGLVHGSADWETHRGTMRQRVDIDCVLVSANRSADLARALQSAQDYDDYRLPTSDEDDDQIDHGEWSIRSWLRRDERDRGLDRHDPWAAGLYARMPRPGDAALTAIGAHGDVAERSWRDQRGSLKLRAEIWSDGEEGDRDLIHDRGRRLLATRATLDRLMRRTGRDLLFEIRFRVERVETRHSRYMEKEAFDEVRITRYLVLRPGHAAEATPRGSGARRDARRRIGT